MSGQLNFRVFLLVWLKIGLLSFGGPAGQIALMHRILVEERKWLDDARFLHALNFCMLLPGPEAMQLAAYTGWLLRGIRGGLIAGLLFILPGALVVYLLTLVYVLLHDLPLVEACFLGIKAGVLAIVLQALANMGRRVLKEKRHVLFAVAAFCAIYALNLPFPLVIALAALAGIATRCGQTGQTVTEIKEETTQPAAKTVKTAVILLLLWLAPAAGLLAAGHQGVFLEIFMFFSKLAVVTFGGAYAVLTYMTQQAVEHYGWLVPGEMVDGLGLAETTPGPLILVTQFVGFLAAFRDSGTLSPLLAGSLGVLLTLWATFVPCFLWIFLGAPWMEHLRQNRYLTSAMQGITAAVIGVIAQLALWFGGHMLFAETAEAVWGPVKLLLPDFSTAQGGAFLLFALSCVLLFGFRPGIFRFVLAMAALGGGLHFVQNILS